MGIPSFFSYIIKQHNKDVLYYSIDNIIFEYLFIDANSIIYDVYNKLSKIPNYIEQDDYECLIINNVIESLEKLIYHIQPTIKTYIVFDGICPFAKMKHQRTRRFKSYILKSLPNQNINNNYFQWDTINITPGTPFMKKLTNIIKNHFINNSYIHFSGSDIIGEGESKICKYIREIFNNNNILFKIAFYGLDNDIIMLSILHINYTENIFVFRENNNKIHNNINENQNEKTYIYINIRKLIDSILYEMNCYDKNIERVIDYVFMCFFLGNDFLPKFPSIQIRTHGINLLLDIYRENIGKYNNRFLVYYKPFKKKENMKIILQWKWIGLFIQKLAMVEHKFIILETELRDKLENSLRNNIYNNEIHPLTETENIPMFYREIEKYICPRELHWNWRYYKSLFDIVPNNQFEKEVCFNYLEGLEWTLKYYVHNCPDWKWYYHYEYPPLLQDLTLWVPKNYNFIFFNNYNYNPSTIEEQLKYVIPPIHSNIDEKNNFIKNFKWKWAYCRYLWESNINIIE